MLSHFTRFIGDSSLPLLGSPLPPSRSGNNTNIMILLPPRRLPPAPLAMLIPAGLLAFFLTALPVPHSACLSVGVCLAMKCLLLYLFESGAYSSRSFGPHYIMRAPRDTEDSSYM